MDDTGPRSSDNQGPFNSMTVSVKEKKNVLPGDIYEIKLNQVSVEDEYVAVMPQFYRTGDPGPEWNPQMCRVKDGHALYQNSSDQMLVHNKGVHFRTLGAVKITKEDLKRKITRRSPGPNLSQPEVALEKFGDMKINRKIMTKHQLAKLDEIHRKNQQVFNEDLTDGYNDQKGKSGSPIQAVGTPV